MMTTEQPAAPEFRPVDWRYHRGRRIECRAATVTEEHADGTVSLLVEGVEPFRVPAREVFPVQPGEWAAKDWQARYGREHLRGR